MLWFAAVTGTTVPVKGETTASKDGSTPAGDKPASKSVNDVREIIESIAFAFVLAFVLKSFLAEAFVIPTGSMAPTLYGRNKDVVCAGCGLHYAVGASDEVDGITGVFEPRRRATDSICGSCRYMNDITDLPVFTGDRILVNKWSYDVSNPQRWDVVVFKYPEDPKTNFIKRLVGLPGESIRVMRGDVYARKGTEGEFQILRKDDPGKQLVLQQLVYDDLYPPKALIGAGFPERWTSVEQTQAPGSLVGWTATTEGWKSDREKRLYHIEKTEGDRWLRYRHYLPQETDWDEALHGRKLSRNPEPQLITDVCPYNDTNLRPDSDKPYWAGDLTLTADITIGQLESNGELTFELTRGVRNYRCVFNNEKGTLTLQCSNDLKQDGSFETLEEIPLRLTVRKHRIIFANVDQRLCVWVNGSLQKFPKGGTYDPPMLPGPTNADLSPAGILAKNMTIDVTNLKLQRDIYYRADQDGGFAHMKSEYDGFRAQLLSSLLTNPEKWEAEYQSASQIAEFAPLGSDEFFMMGDNSPQSSDSRLWGNMRGAIHRHAVPRADLVGKAFFIFWPHGVPFMNDGKGYAIPLGMFYHHDANGRVIDDYPKMKFPFYPQWWRWKFIR